MEDKYSWKGIRLGGSATQELCRSIKMGKEVYVQMAAEVPKHHGPKTEEEKTRHALLVLPLTKVECPMPLYYVLFGKKRHLLCRPVHIFEDSSIPLLSQIPHNVYHHAIEPPAVLLLNLACRLLPPFGN
jgi:hypothetical protein